MDKVIFMNILVGALYVTTEISGESCGDESRPTMRDLASCCTIDRGTPPPKQKETEQSAKSCFEAHKNEYQSLSEEEAKAKGGKFGEYNCIIECIYKKIGIVSEDGVLDKKKFLEMTTERFSGELKEPASTSITKCLDTLEAGRDKLCSKSGGGFVQLGKCFMAEMVKTCPDKHFNDTEVCRNGKEYLKDCTDFFLQE